MRRSLLLIAVLLVARPVPAASFDQGVQAFEEGRYDAALTSLTEFVQGAGAGKDAAEAHYLIAAIHDSRGETDQFRESLEDLLETAPGSPFSLNALDRLSELALNEQRWNDVITHSATFLERYLAESTATVESPMAAEMAGRMLAAARGLHGSEPSAREALEEEFPVGTWTGRVIRVHQKPLVRPGANLLRNPGFEWDGQPVGSPIGWTLLGSEPNLLDDLDGTMGAGAALGMVEPHGGEYVAGKYTNYGAHRGWLYQQAAVQPGLPIQLTAWGMTLISQHTPGRIRLGLDPHGGTAPQSPGVRWSEYVSPTEEWTRLALPASVTPNGATVTVYLEIEQDTPAPDNAMVFDDVVLKQEGR